MVCVKDSLTLQKLHEIMFTETLPTMISIRNGENNHTLVYIEILINALTTLRILTTSPHENTKTAKNVGS